MVCGCGGKRRVKSSKPFDVMGGYKNLTNQQIKKRLETFKRMYCKACQGRYNCNYEAYVACEVRPKNENKT